MDLQRGDLRPLVASHGLAGLSWCGGRRTGQLGSLGAEEVARGRLGPRRRGGWALGGAEDVARAGAVRLVARAGSRSRMSGRGLALKHGLTHRRRGDIRAYAGLGRDLFRPSGKRSLRQRTVRSASPRSRTAPALRARHGFADAGCEHHAAACATTSIRSGRNCSDRFGEREYVARDMSVRPCRGLRGGAVRLLGDADRTVLWRRLRLPEGRKRSRPSPA